MASEFNKAQRYIKQGDEYKLLSYATSAESVEMTDGTDLQTKMDNVDAGIDKKIADLVNSAPETLDTLGEIAQAIEDNKDVVDALDAAITNKVDKEEGKGLFSGSYDDLTDTPTLVAGDNVTITEDEETNQVTISSTANSIDDSTVSNDTTWSSNKLNIAFQDKNVDIISKKEMNGWEKILYTGATFFSICYAKGVFVVVGEKPTGYGTIIYSTNGGITWSPISEKDDFIPSALTGVTYGNGRFIAVGYGGICFYSDDGINWFEGAQSTGDFADIVYGNGVFATVSISGNWQYTVDGTSWVKGGSCYNVQSIAFGNGIFVAVNNADSYAIHYSYDGLNWSTYSGNAGNLYCARFLNGKFIAVGASKIYYSEDGRTWNEGSGITATCKGVAYGNGLYVAVSSDSTTTFYSTDGITWSTTVDGVDITPITNYQNRVDYGEGTFISAYDGGLSTLGFLKEERNLEEVVNEILSDDGGVNIIDITSADYEDLENKETDTNLYNITDADEYITASNVTYGNSDVETALDGINTTLLNKITYARFSTLGTEITSTDAHIIPFDSEYYNLSEEFIINEDGTITYNGDKQCIAFVSAKIYFFTGTIGIKNINICRDGVSFARSVCNMANNYNTVDMGINMIALSKGQKISVTWTGADNDVIGNSATDTSLNIICFH